jgi:hypothetical protein
MKLHRAVIAFLCISLTCGLWILGSQVNAEPAASEEKITVLNPMGMPPPTKLRPMAPRLDTIEGKTIYIINDGYPGSNILCAELEKGFKETYPNTTFIYKDKPGGMGGRAEALWAEMEENADAMIIPLGH